MTLCNRRLKNQYLKENLDEVKDSISGKTLRALDLATQKVAFSGLNVFPIRDLNFDMKLGYDREVSDTPSVFVCGDIFNVDHAIICKTSQEKSLIGEPTPPLMRGWI